MQIKEKEQDLERRQKASAERGRAILASSDKKGKGTLLRLLLLNAACVALLCALVFAVSSFAKRAEDLPPAVTGSAPGTLPASETAAPGTDAPETADPAPETSAPEPYPTVFREDPNTADPGASLSSGYCALVDLSTGKILAAKNASARLYPASMTKVMTLLTASSLIGEEKLKSESFRMTSAIIDPLVRENATRAGFLPGEDVSLMDYMYGAILPSGADATVALALYSAGSEAAFAEKMNEKAKELGLTGSHFTNSTGLHDDSHYTTAKDMAVIMAAALSDPICREVLSTYTYVTHTREPLELTSSALARMSANKTKFVTVFAGKTGFTTEARNCLVTAASDVNGKVFVAVCASAEDRQKIQEDTRLLYDTYCR